jgi:hypothetical protein
MKSEARACSNETRSGIVLRKGVDAVKNSRHGHRGRHPTDVPADGSFPKNTLGS